MLGWTQAVPVRLSVQNKITSSNFRQPLQLLNDRNVLYDLRFLEVEPYKDRFSWLELRLYTITWIRFGLNVPKG